MEIKGINESIYMVLSVCQHSNVCPLLIGNPGCGKTTSVEMYAEINGMNMVLLRGSQSSPEEILGYEVNDGDESVRSDLRIKKSSKICPKWFDQIHENHEKGIKTLLFLDEITTASAFVQAALLQVIFGRSIDNGFNLPEDTFVVAAGNYASNLSSEFNLLPPLMNRFCIFNVVVGNNDVSLFLSKYGKATSESKIRAFKSAYEKDANSYKEGVVKNIGDYIEKQLVAKTESLIKVGKFNPNSTDMSDIYQSLEGSVLPGFVTLRSLNYLRDVSVSTYLLYGSEGIYSSCYSMMVQGLVGISLDNSSKKVAVGKEYLELIKKSSNQLDRLNNPVSSSIDDKLKDLKGQPTAEALRGVCEVLESINNDPNLKKVKCPVSDSYINDIIASVLTVAKSAINDSGNDYGNLAKKYLNKNLSVDEKKSKFLGEMSRYNQAALAYNAVRELVKNRPYSQEILNNVNNTTSFSMRQLEYRAQYLIRKAADELGSLSGLVSLTKINGDN